MSRDDAPNYRWFIIDKSNKSCSRCKFNWGTKEVPRTKCVKHKFYDLHHDYEQTVCDDFEEK